MSKKLYYRDKNIWTTIRNISIFLMAFGLFTLFIGVVSPTPDYEDMTLASVTVQSLNYVFYYRGTAYMS